MPNVFDSSTVTTPSLPTLSMASAITSPMAGSPAEMVATCAISDLSSTSFACFLIDSTAAFTACSMPRFRSIGFAPAATLRRPFVHERLREHGGGGGAVTGHVVGLGGDLLHQLRAHVLERVVELDLAGDGDAVVGDRRRAELLLEHDVAAPRAEGDLDRVGELVDARFEPATRRRRRTSASSASGTYFFFLESWMASTSRPERISRSSPSTVISVPPYLL